MGQFSRVNKNKEMYQNILEEKDSQIIDASLRDFERRTSKTKVSKDTYQASRYKVKDNYISLTSGDEDIVEELEEVSVEEVSPILNEEETKVYGKEIIEDKDLLSDFIEEVKHYNINKGLRSFQDTQSNILSNLQKNNELERPKVVVELTSEIQKIIDDLENQNEILEEKEETKEVLIDNFKPLNDNDDRVIAEMLDQIETSALNVIEPINELLEQTSELALVEETLEADLVNPVNSYEANELLELTQTLSMKLDLQENELNEVKEHTSFLDKLLTVIIVLLVLALIGLAVFGIWYVKKERGF